MEMLILGLTFINNSYFCCMTDFEKFIIEHADSDTASLMLSMKKWPAPEGIKLGKLSSKDVAVNTIEARKKLRKKVPDWWERTDLIYPTALCAEQCSSSATAAYKAELARKIIHEYATDAHVIADLTGGLGIDAAAFSKIAGVVLYNDMNPVLAEAARHNFNVLGIENIRISCTELTAKSLPDILRSSHYDTGNFGLEQSETMHPDIIFLDPSRRGSNGNRFYMIEDCQPNVLELLPALFSYSRNILLKLSPMADISLITEQLNHCYEEYSEKTFGTGWNRNWIREIHVVAIAGECKELLVWMDRDWDGDATFLCVEDGRSLKFSQDEIVRSKAVLPDSTFMRVLFEPGKSITKAGAFNAICSRFGLVKLGKFTHLYTFSQPLSEAELKDKEETLEPFGKIFSVKEILTFDKASIKKIKNEYPNCEVAARNIPLSSDELRSRLGVKSGDDAMIFGARIETPVRPGNYLIICDKGQTCRSMTT